MDIEQLIALMNRELDVNNQAIIEHLDKKVPTLDSQKNSHNYDYGKLVANEQMLNSYIRILGGCRETDEHENKKFELEHVKKSIDESGADKFMLVCCMNGRETMFRWCDSEYNFIGLTNEMDGFYTYTWEELLEVYDNAIEWIEGCRKDGMNASRIQVMTIQ